MLGQSIATARHTRSRSTFAFRKYSDLHSQEDTQPATQQPMEIIIIGAGIAGLACAAELEGVQDIKVKVLEARDRLGGRICSWDVDGVAVDLGASWMHGTIGNPLLDLLKSTGSLRLASSDSGDSEDDLETRIALPSGLLDSKLGNVVGMAIWTLFEEMNASAKDMSQEEAQKTSVFDYLSSKLDETWQAIQLTCQTQNISIQIFSKKDLLSLMQIIEMYDAADLRKLSMETFQNDESGEGGTPFVVSSLAKVIPIIALKTSCPILLNTEVEKIEWSESRAIVKTKNAEFSCDRVVCTIPLGVLKSSPKLFVPPLPLKKQEAIQQVAFGTLDKVVLVFHELKWDANVSHFYTFVDPLSSFGKKWTDLRLEDAIYPTETRDEPILVSFMSLYPYHEKPILVAYCGNQKLVRMWNYIGSDAVVQHMLTHLNETLGLDIDQASLKAYHFTNWSADAHARGAYTSFSVSKTAVPFGSDLIKQLAEPVGCVSFAGEHTHSGLSSYAHGAYLSGYLAAQAIKALHSRI